MDEFFIQEEQQAYIAPPPEPQEDTPIELGLSSEVNYSIPHPIQITST